MLQQVHMLNVTASMHVKCYSKYVCEKLKQVYMLNVTASMYVKCYSKYKCQMSQQVYMLNVRASIYMLNVRGIYVNVLARIYVKC